MSKLANDFLTAIGILTEDAVAKSGAIKMIEAVISATKINEIDTNYKIEYQNTEFLAVGSAGYNKGDKVYVITPSDNTQLYSIHSLVRSSSDGEEIYQSETDKYDITSANLISGTSTAIGWNGDINEDNEDDEEFVKVLYDYDDPNPQPIEVHQDNNELANQFNKTEVLQVQAKFIYDFTVDLDLHYDLVFTFITEEGKELKYDFSINDMPNNPYVSEGQIVAKNFILPEDVKILRLQSIAMSRNMAGKYQIQNMKIYGAIKNNLQAGYSTHIIADRFAFTEGNAIIEYDVDDNGDIIKDENGDPVIEKKYWDPIMLSAYMRKDGVKLLDSTTDNTNVYYKWYLENEPGTFRELTSSPSFGELNLLGANNGDIKLSEDETQITLTAAAQNNYCIITKDILKGSYRLKTKSTGKGRISVFKQSDIDDIKEIPDDSSLASSSSMSNPELIFTCSEDDKIAFKIDNDLYDKSADKQIANTFSDFELIKLDNDELSLSIDDIFLAEKRVKCESFYAYDNGVFIAESNATLTLENKVPNGVYSLTLSNDSNGAPHLRKLTVNVTQPFDNNKTLKYAWKRDNVNIEETLNTINVNAAIIKESETYHCQVQDENNLYIGEINTEILMIPEIDVNNRIVITGAKSYLYNESGNRIDGLPISNLEVFFYNEDQTALIPWKNDEGKENFSINWSLKPSPSGAESMIILPDKQEDREKNILTFALQTTYNPLYTNNIIQVSIQYKEEEAKIAYAEISIERNGEPGTNGTQYICRIKPSLTITDSYPDIIQIQKNSNTKITLTPKLFNNNTAEDISIDTVKWEKQNENGSWETFNYTSNASNSKAIDYICNEATIIRVTVQEAKDKSNIYYGYLTIATYTDSKFQFEPTSGYSHVLYSSSGNQPRYRNSEFLFNTEYTDISQISKSRNLFNFNEITEESLQFVHEGTGEIDAINKTVTLTASDKDNYFFVSPFKSFEPGCYQFSVDIDNFVAEKGELQLFVCEKTTEGYKEQHNGGPLIEFDIASKDQFIALRVDNERGAGSSMTFSNFKLIKVDKDVNTLPPPKYSEINSSIHYIFSANGGKAEVDLPILHLINRYEYAAINGWDGESIVQENGTVISPMAGFGEKHNDNSFTGVLLGNVKKGDGTARNGLFGLNQGIETFILDSTDGSATFGIEGGGQIKLKPGEDGIIESGNFKLNDTTDGTNNGGGMQINLTKPEIHWGSGNFIVDENGYLTAVNGTFSGNLSSASFSAKTDGSVQIGKINAGISVASDGSVTIDQGVDIKSDVEATGLTVKDDEGAILFQAKSADPENVKIGNWQVTSNLLKSPTYKSGGYYYRCFLQSPPNEANVYEYTNFEIQKSSLENFSTITSTPFFVRPNGQLHAEDIEATGGIIGGFKLNEYRLESTVNSDNNGVGMCSTTGHGYAFWAGPYDTTKSPGETSAFRVGHDGSLRATSATITGTSTIGDWEITDGALTLGKIRLGYGEGGSSIPSIGVKRTSTNSYSFYADTAGYVKMTADGYYNEQGTYSSSNVQGSLAAFYYLMTTQGGYKLYIPLFQI